MNEDMIDLDPDSEHFAINYGFPEAVVKHAMRLLNP
jgi:hypothetical protein